MQGLRDNAFSQLGLSPRSKQVAIEERVEDLLADHPDREAEFLRLRQTLLTPTTRLSAELSFPSDLAPARAKKALRTVEDGSREEVIALIADLPALSAANFAEASLERFPDAGMLECLVECHTRLDGETLLSQINSTRAASGFPKVQDSQLKQELRRLRELHAKAAIHSVVRLPGGPAHLASAIETSKDSLHVFVTELARQYDHWSAPLLNELQTKIYAQTAALEQGDASTPALLALLEEWDALSQPAQVYAQLSELDEERTRRIYLNVREACLTLANDQGRFNDALLISRTMQTLFAELPTAASQLKRDILDLEALVGEQTLLNRLRPLLDELESRFLETQRQAQHSRDDNLGAAIYSSLRPKLLPLLDEPECANQAVQAVNTFAVRVNNELNLGSASVGILEALTADTSAVSGELQRVVATNLRAARRNVCTDQLRVAVNQQSWSRAEGLARTLIALTDDHDEQAQLRQLHGRLVERRDRGQGTLWAWGMVLAAVAGLGLLSQCQGGSSARAPDYASEDFNSPSDYAPPLSPAPSSDPYADSWEGSVEPTESGPYGPPAEPLSPTTPGEGPGSSSADGSTRYGLQQVVPPEGVGRELTYEQIVYCELENAFLSRLATELDSLPRGRQDLAVAPFNARVDDYNARCASFRYRGNSVERARTAASAVSSEIAADAARAVAEWTQ